MKPNSWLELLKITLSGKGRYDASQRTLEYEELLQKIYEFPKNGTHYMAGDWHYGRMRLLTTKIENAGYVKGSDMHLNRSVFSMLPVLKAVLHELAGDSLTREEFSNLASRMPVPADLQICEKMFGNLPLPVGEKGPSPKVLQGGVFELLEENMSLFRILAAEGPNLTKIRKFLGCSSDTAFIKLQKLQKACGYATMEDMESGSRDFLAKMDAGVFKK